MRLEIQGRTMVAALAIVAAALGTATLARGEEPCEKCQSRFNLKTTGIPVLESIPYVGRLFKNSAYQPACAEEVERIGIDFEFVPGQVIEFHGPLDVCPAVCPDVCPACPVAVAKGTDVDQPRNLAKSVTVE